MSSWASPFSWFGPANRLDVDIKGILCLPHPYKLGDKVSFVLALRTTIISNRKNIKRIIWPTMLTIDGNGAKFFFFPPFLSFLIVVAFLPFPQLYYVERSCPFQDIPPPSPQRAMASYLAHSKRCVKSGGKRVNQQCSTLTRIGRGRNFVG